jgi:hypothetical protein
MHMKLPFLRHIFVICTFFPFFSTYGCHECLYKIQYEIFVTNYWIDVYEYDPDADIYKYLVGKKEALKFAKNIIQESKCEKPIDFDSLDQR